MKARIISQKLPKEGFDISKLKTTMASLEKHGFKTLFFDGNTPPDENLDLVIVQGMTVESLRQDQRVIVNHNGYCIMLSCGFKRGANLTPATDTPEPKLWSQLKLGDEKVLGDIVEEYPKWFEGHYQLAMLYLNKKFFSKAFEEFGKARLYKTDINYELGYVKEWRDYGLDFNQGLCAYYAGELEHGRLFVDRVIMNRNSKHELVVQSYRNYEFYAKPLKVKWNKEYIVNNYDLPEKVKAYKSLNPSLLRKNKKEIYLNIRIVNWHVNPIGFNKYFSPHPKNKFKTKNLLATINNSGDFVSKPQLIMKGEGVNLGKIRSHHIDGFEDCRLFHLQGGVIYFISNCTKNNPKGPMRLSVGQIDVNGETPKYTKLTPIYGHGDHLTQKNWLIYRVEGAYAYAIYGYNPLTIVKINLNTGIVEPVSEARLPVRSGEFRGSGGPVPFEDGYLVVIHQVYFKDHGGRRYLHRFLYLDEYMIPVGFSELWYLKSKDIEYVSTILDVGDDFLIGYGMCDRCACISLVTKETIKKMFNPISDYM